MHRIYDFCFIDVRTILLALSVSIECDRLQVISFPLDKGAAWSVSLDLPSLEEYHQHYSLELKTDGGGLIGVCVGIDMVVRYVSTLNSDSDYLLVIDRPGLLKFLAREGAAFLHRWAEWESGITTIYHSKTTRIKWRGRCSVGAS